MLTRLEKMRSLCNDRKISIAKLERMSDIANGSIDGWDRHPPKLGTLDKVARSLGIPITELIDTLSIPCVYHGRENRRRRTNARSV